MPAWTYTEDLENNRRDRVRHLIGDTDEDDKILYDNEVDYHLNRQTNDYLAAAECCDSAATRYMRMIMRRSGTLELNLAGQDMYAKRAAQLRDLADDSSAPVMAGAFYASGATHPPLFWFGMTDNPPNDANSFPPSYGSGSDTPTELGGP